MLTPEEYAEKRQARYNRLLAAAKRTENESAATLDQARAMAEVIPFGQPILTCHHSEKQDRKYRERIHNKHRRGYELAKRAEELKSRAASIENNSAIYSDNPEAVQLLKDKISTLKAEQAEIKRINAALRKGADFETLEMSEEHRAALLMIEKVQAYYKPLTRGFPPYRLQNINAQIKNAEKRAERVGKLQSLKDYSEMINGLEIEHNPTENRIRIKFPERVPLEIYQEMKRAGYRTTKDKKFSAYYNHRTIQAAKEQAEKWSK